METIQRMVVSIRGIHPTVLETISGDEHPTTFSENRNGKRPMGKQEMNPLNTQRIDVPRKMIEMHRKTTFSILLLTKNIPTHTFQ
jgi:hypothetical protein